MVACRGFSKDCIYFSMEFIQPNLNLSRCKDAGLKKDCGFLATGRGMVLEVESRICISCSPALISCLFRCAYVMGDIYFFNLFTVNPGLACETSRWQ